jgi:flagellar hook-basal body complex protein FliE
MVPVDPIASVLQQMHTMANEAAKATTPDASSATSQVSFADVLQQSLAEISNRQALVAGETQAFEIGAPNVSSTDLSVDGAEAGILLQRSLQIRNRLVSAYTDIMQIPL